MHPQLNDLEAKKSPVKITGCSNKINLYTQEDDVVIKENKTVFEDNQEVIPYTSNGKRRERIQNQYEFVELLPSDICDLTENKDCPNCRKLKM